MDDRLLYRRCKHSGLPARTRNAGIELATGEYTAFLDGDDLWYQGKLETVETAFRHYPETGVVCHDESLIKMGKPVGTNRYGPASSNMFRQLLFEGNLLSTSATTVRTALLKDLGGFCELPDLYCVEDYDLWLRLSQYSARFQFLQKVLGAYRIHDANSSNVGGRNSERFYGNLRFAVTRNFDLIASPSKEDATRLRKILADTHYQCAKELFVSGQHACSYRQILNAGRQYPLSVPRYSAGFAKCCFRNS